MTDIKHLGLISDTTCFIMAVLLSLTVNNGRHKFSPIHIGDKLMTDTMLKLIT